MTTIRWLSRELVEFLFGDGRRATHHSSTILCVVRWGGDCYVKVAPRSVPFNLRADSGEPIVPDPHYVVDEATGREIAKQTGCQIIDANGAPQTI